LQLRARALAAPMGALECWILSTLLALSPSLRSPHGWLWAARACSSASNRDQEKRPMAWMQIVSGVVAVALLIYLIAALIDAENL
jgi:K+-transporting ATPase KdpF subunit